jgi:hypothetical protein
MACCSRLPNVTRAGGDLPEGDKILSIYIEEN